MAKTDVPTVTRFLRDGYGVATWTTPYDGVSAVDIDPDGMVRASLPVDGHRFAEALEVGGRAMNLLYPSPGICCAHGLVKDGPVGSGWPGGCSCGQEPIGANPAREG